VALAAAVAALLALSGCQDSGARTPTGGGESAIVLRLGLVGARSDPDGVAAAAFAAAVARRTGGQIEIRTTARAAADGPGLLARVRDGRLDLAGVPTAAFDRAGLRAFAPLQAPLLVTSYALERRVIDGPVGAAMLAQVEGLGLTGLALYERGLQRPLWSGPARVGRAGAAPRVASPPSGVLAAGWRALGARPREVAPGRLAAALAGGAVDGAAVSLATIQAERLYEGAPAVSADLVLWPSPAALVAHRPSLAALSSGQQEALRAAAAALPARSLAAQARPSALAAVLCQEGVRFEPTPAPARARLRRAGERAARALARDPASRRALARIRALAAGTPAPAPLPACPAP
jgi:TRAP-type C4-dicarboxylate transport system substrate-binding protein